MGIDYVVDYACEPKRALSTQEIVSMLKSRQRVEEGLAMARGQGDHRPPEAFTFEVVTQTPEGAAERVVSARELLDEASPLDEHAHHCIGCPAHRPGGAFDAYGCYGHIPYPIPRAAEAWLLSLLPKDLRSTAGQLLLRVLYDFEWDGRHAAEMRREAGIFFAAEAPSSRRWERGHESVEITSDQVFDMIFAAGPLEPEHAFMLCLFFGVIPHDVDPDQLTRALTDRARMAAMAHGGSLPPEPEEGSGGLRRLLDALRACGALSVTLLVDG